MSQLSLRLCQFQARLIPGICRHLWLTRGKQQCKYFHWWGGVGLRQMPGVVSGLEIDRAITCTCILFKDFFLNEY